jgi:hypothetical protein
MKTLIVLIALSLMTGCVYKNEPTNVDGIKERLAYFKDDYGNCFAAVSSVGYADRLTIALATIPCERMP